MRSRSHGPALRAAQVLVAAVLLLMHPLVWPSAHPAARAEPVGPPPSGVAGLDVGTGLSVVLVEAATGQVLLARDADVRRPVASAIKLVTALTVVEHLPSGSTVAIGTEVRGVEGSSFALRAGDVRAVDDLLVGLLLRSGNDAAVALAVATAGSEAAFVDRMVVTLAGLGIDARPGSSSGLEPEDALSALELAAVSRAVLAEPRLRPLLGLRAIELTDGALIENRNLFLADMPDATGLKTGFTSAAGFTLAASALRDGRELIAVVLGATDDLERRTVAARLLEHGFGATRRIDVDRSVTLRTTSGPVRFATVPTPVTLGTASELTVAWPPTLRPEDDLRSVRILTDASEAGSVAVERLDGRQPASAPTLGRALAEGVYAGLRPVGLAGGPGTLLR